MITTECETIQATLSPPPDTPLSPLWTIDKTQPASVVYPLSSTAQSLLSEENCHWSQSGDALSLAISGILESATFLFQSASDCHHFVARCGEHLVVKAISDPDSTEYTMLQFLETTLPVALAPKPHGVISIGDTWYMFMDFIPGVNLATAWPSLTETQKEDLSCELNILLYQLREVPFECGNPLGGLGGQGCKDLRRHTRTASAPIYSSEELWEFMYGCARNKDTVYGKFLRQQTFPPRKQKIVLTHGDFRPANIMVNHSIDADIRITGLIDWEMSGFYPEDIECTRALNNLSPIGNDDWYLYLPECISPRNHLESWHADWVWDPYIS
jgi:aminoglycoside phosphotransferase